MAEDEQVAHDPGERHHAIRQGVLVDVVRVVPESSKRQEIEEVGGQC